MSSVYATCCEPKSIPIIHLSDFVLVVRPEILDLCDPYGREREVQWACHMGSMGSLTVLDRMTGYGWRDTETGYRDWYHLHHSVDFWLATGNCDVRHIIDPINGTPMNELIAWVKKHANALTGNDNVNES